jgi:hypothetical protein
VDYERNGVGGRCSKTLRAGAISIVISAAGSFELLDA